MKSAAIISKPAKNELHAVVPEVIDWLTKRDYRVLMDQQTAAYGVAQNVFPRYELGWENPSFAIVLGGDGTLLAAARAVARQGIPILAINLGSLGFLTEVPLPSLFETLAARFGNIAGFFFVFNYDKVLASLGKTRESRDFYRR